MRQRLLTPLILFGIAFAVTHTHLEASLTQQEESPRDDKSYYHDSVARIQTMLEPNG